jgi:hypothetical protein
MKHLSRNTVSLAVAAACSAGLLSGFELEMQSGIVCATTIQDRSPKPQSTEGLDGLLAQTLVNAGMMVVQVPFDPPADVQHAARLNGCSYIMYTDIVHVKESGASRTCRVLKRFAWEDSLPTIQAQIEFRLYHVDEVLPRVSTSVVGKTGSPRSFAYVTSYVIGVEQPPTAPPSLEAKRRTVALGDAFDRQAKAVFKGLSEKTASLESIR